MDLTSVVAFDEIVTCLPIVQEVLQGFRDERPYDVGVLHADRDYTALARVSQLRQRAVRV